MKKTYSAPIVDIIILNSSTDLMGDAPVEPISNTTTNYDSNTVNIDVEEDNDDFLRPSRSLWE